MNVSVYLRGDYVKNEEFQAHKNKANSKPIQSQSADVCRKHEGTDSKIVNPEIIRQAIWKNKANLFEG